MILFIKIYLIIGIILTILSAIAAGGFSTLTGNMFKEITEQRKKPDIFDLSIIIILLLVNLVVLWLFWLSLFLKNYNSEKYL